MPRKSSPSPLVWVAATGFTLGLFGTALWSADDARLRPPSLPELQQLTRLEPVRVLPRTELLLMTVEASGYLEAGRPWAAWRLLRERMDDPTIAPAGAVLLAARAASEWGNWRDTRDLLRGQAWLQSAEGGEGLFLLARAEEELGNRAEATAVYRRYLALPGGSSRALAQARLGRVLRESGDAEGAAAAFSAAAAQLPEIEDWLYALRVEQLAAADDSSATTLATRGVGGSAPVRLRRVQAEVAGWIARGDVPRAIRRLDWEARVLRAQGARTEAAQLHLDRARLLLQADAEREARDLLRATALETTVATDLRVAAARMLGELKDLSPAEELARSAAFEAAGKPGLAARALRGALQAGLPDDGALQFKLGHLLYTENDYGPARSAFQRAAEQLQDRERVAEAELLAARSLFRANVGSPSNRRARQRAETARANALAEIRRVAEKYEGTAAAGTALFLLGDEAPSLSAALSYYRRAAAVSSSPDAREALFRVGDRSMKLDNPAAAIAAWEEYVARYPQGEGTARVAYEVGKLHERAGRDEKARAMYTAAVQAEPVSYYAFRAANRLGVDPLVYALATPRPWTGLAADPLEASNVLQRLDALERVGLQAEWKQELDGAVRAFEDRPMALLVLAEGIRDRGYPVEALRLGYRLREKRGEWDERLLRVVFPFPFRRLVEEEAKRADVDPMLLAGLIRQESTFRPAVRSWVGATGLSQIMPATGRWLAPSVGVKQYEDRLLEVPEVNVRMGAKYLGDLVDRYDGARDLALAGYNAGPGRADRWRRELRHGRDTDAFREAIPFDETRHYVKVVLRNAAIYERLYGEQREPGLVRSDD